MPPTVGRYRIERVLGSGAFASVWLAHDDVLNAPVAIKVLAGSLIDDLDVRNRFLEEARILRRADSERLVRVHDIGDLPDGRPYFVMSYADRGTLADRMRGGAIPADEALRLAEETAYGVAVINRFGIIHRDLKPSNVLFQSIPERGERVLIADLGLAKALAHASGAFTLPVGTPGYMPPEQARFGGGLDVRADVYGLGALTYHLLTGRPPGPAPVKVPPSALRAGVPEQADHVIMRALEVDRDRRWSNAETFAAAVAKLRVALSGHSAEPWEEVEITVSDEDLAVPDETVQDSIERTIPTPDETSPPARQPVPRSDSGFGEATPAADITSLGHAFTEPEPAERTVVEDDDRTWALPPLGQPAQPAQPGQSGQPGRSGRPGQSGLGPAFPPPPGLAGPPRPSAPPSLPGPPEPSGPVTGDQSAADRRHRRRLWLAAAAAATVMLVGGSAAVMVLLNRLPTGDGDEFVTVRDSTQKLSVTVPKEWIKQREEGWEPRGVSLDDPQRRPALRATPDLAGFRNVQDPTPGVFLALTTDTTRGRLPPPGLDRPGCVPQPARPYRRGSLSGQIVSLKCGGGITYREVGLTDAGGTFAVYVEIKQAGGEDLANRILDSVRAGAP